MTVDPTRPSRATRQGGTTYYWCGGGAGKGAKVGLSGAP
jgi:hypothetical protein